MELITKYKISIKGLNLHNILSFFQNEKIHLTEVEKVNHKKLFCTISKQDFFKLKKNPIVKKYKIHIEKRYGIEKYSRNFLTHIGLFIGIIVCFLTTFNLTNKIYDVKIIAEEHVCQNAENCIFNDNNLKNLYLSLEKYGLKKNSKLNKSTIKNIKNQLMLDYPQISDLSVEHRGVYTLVKILEGKLPTNLAPTKLKASQNGIVINTNITSGKLKVKIGDIVFKGDTLIEPTDTPACGSVTLRTFYHESMIFDENQISYERTGKSLTVNDVNLFNFKITSSANNYYNLYETINSCRYLSLNTLLPIKLHQTTYYELKKKETFVPFESQREILYSKLKEKTRLLLDKNATEKNTTFSVKQEGSRFLINCYIEAYLKLNI